MVTLECHVLNDGRRVLTQREMVRVLSGGRESGNLGRYLSRNPLIETHPEPFPFVVPPVPQPARGYEATLLIEICEAYLQARDQGLLKPSQLKLAVMAEIIMRASAKLGIIALIDEATGYQEVRQKQALQIKLQAFIADEMQDWARMYRERVLAGACAAGEHPVLATQPADPMGKYVMAFVYDAIDADVGGELRELNPNPHYRENHHQWLKQFGRERVHDHLQRVIAVMKLCDDMPDFNRKFAYVFKKKGLQMSFDDLWEA